MIYVFNLVCIMLNIFYLEKTLHVFQRKDYRISRYFRFFTKKHVFFTFLCLFFVVLKIFFKNLLLNLVLDLSILIIQSLTVCSLINSNKTPLKYTSRIKRLYLISAILTSLSILTPYPTIISSLIVYIAPPVANLLNFYDKIKNKKFIKTASKKIKTSNIKIIAITGSNGKTSVKNILLKILSSTYKVLASPESYNTPIGIAKFINESHLENIDFLILEYGARQNGDIKTLCEIFGADFGIITTIAPQHLETFKNIENIKKTKNELADFLGNKLCIYNADNEHCHQLYLKKKQAKLEVSIRKKTYYSATNIDIKNGTTNFLLNIGNSQNEVKTKLLGEHNIFNILLASTMAHAMNVSTKNIIKAIENLEPTPHRLQLIKSHINILDDTYNCSLDSATEALKVLSHFDGKKMVATPGIIEGGKNESFLNYKLGELCTFCDYVVIIGNHNKEAIYSGLKSANFSDKKICFAKNLDEAKQYFHLLSQNDTLLLLNDLPDEYN